MPRRARPLEETLEALRRVRDDPRGAASFAELRRVLEREGSHAVARAARLVGELELQPLVPELLRSFPRFLAGLPRADPGCAAKTAIVEALRRLEHRDDALYQTAARHVQLEPVFGGRVDTAVDLRGAAALALAETGGRGVEALLAELLADPEPPVRVSAARALSVRGGEAAIPLLRLKALLQDPEPRVPSECLLALMRLDPAGQWRFVAGFLDRDDEHAEAAATALGESRSSEGLAALREWLPAAKRRGLARIAFAAVAALRRDEAVELLLAVVREEEAASAREALRALGSLGGGDALGERIRTAAAARPELRRELEQALPGGGRRP